MQDYLINEIRIVLNESEKMQNFQPVKKHQYLSFPLREHFYIFTV